MKNPCSINVNGRLISLDTPRVMGIINVTPDSFYGKSRYTGEKQVLGAAEKMLLDGADFLDIGGCSTRPGAEAVDQEEEEKRLLPAIKAILREFPKAIISADTFRAKVARKAVLECGANIINDISGGEADEQMFGLVKELNIPYVLMHMQGTPATMQKNPVYEDIIADILQWFGKKLVPLHQAGVKDIILDPGFGFGKTIENNFELLSRLGELEVAGHAVMAGLSRKSMIWKSLGLSPEESLTGTTVLNTVALLNGASILRVHDVKEAREAVKLVGLVKRET
ncbi:MAG TPA: dihydropteroate synthase [Bacteroidales bacterium]|nr:dihydropteroate synthase [Bacteroidales bacterium]